jgi:hypothetical protein
MFAVCSTMIETLGEAKSLGCRITARCAGGRRDGVKSRRECAYRYELEHETLIWTRGTAYPISMLPERLKMSAVRLAAGGASVEFAVRTRREAGVNTLRLPSRNRFFVLAFFGFRSSRGSESGAFLS